MGNCSRKLTCSKIGESALGREQIPLCKTHQAVIQKNGLSLNNFKGYQKSIRLLNSSKIRIK